MLLDRANTQFSANTELRKTTIMKYFALVACLFFLACHSKKPTSKYFHDDESINNLINSNFANLSSSLSSDVLYAGQGYNSNTGQRMDAIVVDTPLVTVLHSLTENYGQEVYLSLKLVNSYEELRTSLSVDVSASLEMGAFKGSSEVKMLNDQSFNSFSTFLLMNLQVINPTLGLNPQNYKLTQKAVNLLNNPDNFVRSFGNQFVSSLETGGSLYILFEYKSSSASEKKALTVKLSAQVKQLFGRAKLDAEIKNTFEKIEWSNSLNVTFAGTGVCGKLPALDKDSLVEYMRNFPDMVIPIKCPSVTGVSKTANSVLAEITNKDMFNVFINERHFLQDCVYKNDSLATLFGNIKYVENYPDEFDNIDIAALINLKSDIVSKERQIQRMAQDCADNIQLCDAQLIANIQIPKINFKWKGGTSENASSFFDKQIDDIKFIEPIFLDSVGLSGYKTFEIRGRFGILKDLSSKTADYIYNEEKNSYTIETIMTPFGGTYKIQIYLLVYDKQGAIVDQIPYENKPIIIEKKNVFVKLQFIGSGPLMQNDIFILNENDKLKHGYPTTVINNKDTPLHVLIY